MPSRSPGITDEPQATPDVLCGENRALFGFTLRAEMKNPAGGRGFTRSLKPELDASRSVLIKARKGEACLVGLFRERIQQRNAGNFLLPEF